MIALRSHRAFRIAPVCTLLLALSVGLAAAQDEDATPEPESVDLTTKDGLMVRATYYAAQDEDGADGKQVVPVVILHDYKGNRNELHPLALSLQENYGHAVLVPDLRAHGDSTTLRSRDGREITLDVERMRRVDFQNIIRFDLEAVRKFLIKKNNNAELNLNSLCVVGVGMGSVMALNWAARDWSVPRLPGGKQGQDVKGLVLVSPTWSFEGVPIRAALAQPGVREKISHVIIVGEGKGNSKAMKEAQRIYKTIHGARPNRDSDPENKEVFLYPVDTPLQGTKLLNARTFQLDATIAKFIQLRIVDQNFPWEERRTSE